MSYPFLMHAKTTKGMSEDWAYYFQHLYPYPKDSFNAPLDAQPNGEWAVDTHPSDIKLGYADKFSKAIKPGGFYADANTNFKNSSPDEVHEDDIETWGHGPTQEADSGVAATPAQVFDNYIVITPQPKVIRDRVVEQAATDNLVGYSKCQIIGKCDARFKNVLGAPCQNQRQQRGFCNYDAEGDWLCMRTALWWSYGAQYATDTEYKHDIRENVGYQSDVGPSKHGQPTACTPGTKATTDLSGEWQPRLLIGGCMISSDSWHSGWEEVHLPDACQSKVTLPANLGGVGCMDKGAENFNAAARQPGLCKYSNAGCINSLALNYNSEASIDDGSCILGTCGCNMGDPDSALPGAYSTYDGGHHPSTEKYQSLFVGKPLPNGGTEASTGKVVYTEYSAVLEDYVYSPAVYASGTTPTKAAGGAATVLGGRTCGGSAEASLCTFTIEGCMSQTAINYNSQATRNGNTWCVEPKEGCMMPTVDRSSGWSGTRTTLMKNRFGYAIASGTGFYDTSATVHKKSLCTVHNKGCMDATAANYHPWATFQGSTTIDKCYAKKIGCAHKKALNYGCTEFISDSGTGMGGQVILPCEAGKEGGEAPLTAHENKFCVFYEITIAEGNVKADSASITLVVSGECTDFTAALKDSLAAYFLKTIGSKPEVTANCGSLVIENVFTNLDAKSFQKFQLVTATALSSNEGATSFLASAGLEGFTVTSVTVAQVADTAMPPPSAPPDVAAEVGLIVGCVLAGILVVVLSIAAFMCAAHGLAPASPARAHSPARVALPYATLGCRFSFRLACSRRSKLRQRKQSVAPS